MAKESTQKKLSRVRPPRVQITYDVEVGDAIETKELPFVLGVVGDLSGKSKIELPKMKDRKFVNIDKDNFDEVMKGMAPRVQLQVDNRLKEDGSKLAVDLEFTKLDDFHPEAIVENVEPLKKLLEARRRLSDLRNKVVGNNKLEELLEDVVRDTEKLQTIKKTQKSDKGGE